MRLRDWQRELEEDEGYRKAAAELKPYLDLADDVLSLRLARGWSQADLAERVGTRQANISRLESGLANPTLKFLQKVADAVDAELGVQLRPRQTVSDVDVRVTGNSTESSIETCYAAPDWPRWSAPRKATWNDRTSAETVQREVAA